MRSFWIIGLILCGIASTGAMPQFPSTPDCLFSGEGEILFEGNWKSHPVFNDFDAKTKFQLKGIRYDGWSRIRFITDFGESAFEFDDAATSSSFWYRGEDQVLKSSYENPHMFQNALNPFGYAALIPIQLKGKPVSEVNYGPDEIGYRITETTRNEGDIAMDYVLPRGQEIVKNFKQIDSFDYPKLNLDRKFETLNIEWSDFLPESNVATKQTVVVQSIYRITEPTVPITISTKLHRVDPIPPGADVQKLPLPEL